MTRDHEQVVIDDAKVLKATAKALLVKIGAREVWIPQSQIMDDSEVWDAGDEGALVITAWFAEKEGLE